QRRGRQDAFRIADLPLPADERGELAREVVRTRVQRPQRRELTQKLRCKHLEEVFGCGQILEAVLSQVEDHDLAREVAGEATGRLRDEDLATVCRCADA